MFFDTSRKKKSPKEMKEMTKGEVRTLVIDKNQARWLANCRDRECGGKVISN